MSDTNTDPNSPLMAGCQQECTGPCICHAVGLGDQEDACPREKMAAMEIALRASIAYDEARFERIRHKCFGEIPERMKGQPDMWVESVMEVAEEESGKEFRQLRAAALCLPENGEADAPGMGL